MKKLASNKDAFFNFELLKDYEAGLVLRGWEVKSAKKGGVSLKESYISMIDDQAWLVGANFKRWIGMQKSELNQEMRNRKLLLNKFELKQLIEGKNIKGNTIVPVDLYLNHNRLKLKIALARGKKLYDKRQKLKEKDLKRQILRDLKVK